MRVQFSHTSPIKMHNSISGKSQKKDAVIIRVIRGNGNDTESNNAAYDGCLPVVSYVLSADRYHNAVFTGTKASYRP